MATFRKYGGTNFSPISNIVRHNILNSKSSSFNTSGLYNTKETYLSHVDMSGNSLLHVGNVIFQDGTSISSGTNIQPPLSSVLFYGNSAGKRAILDLSYIEFSDGTTLNTASGLQTPSLYAVLNKDNNAQSLGMSNVGNIFQSGTGIINQYDTTSTINILKDTSFNENISVSNIYFSNDKQQNTSYTGWQPDENTSYNSATLTFDTHGKIIDVIDNSLSPFGLENVLTKNSDGGGKNMTNLGNITQSGNGENLLKATKFEGNITQSGTGIINQYDTTSTINILKDTSFNENISVSNIYFSNDKQQNTSYTGWQPDENTSYNSATLTFDTHGKIIDVIDNSLSPFGLENVLTKNSDGGGKNMTNISEMTEIGHITQQSNKIITQSGTGYITQSGTTGTNNTLKATQFDGNITQTGGTIVQIGSGSNKLNDTSFNGICTYSKPYNLSDFDHDDDIPNKKYVDDTVSNITGSLGQGLELVGSATLQVKSDLNFLKEVKINRGKSPELETGHLILSNDLSGTTFLYQGGKNLVFDNNSNTAEYYESSFKFACNNLGSNDLQTIPLIFNSSLFKIDVSNNSQGYPVIYQACNNSHYNDLKIGHNFTGNIWMADVSGVRRQISTSYLNVYDISDVSIFNNSKVTQIFQGEKQLLFDNNSTTDNLDVTFGFYCNNVGDDSKQTRPLSFNSSLFNVDLSNNSGGPPVSYLACNNSNYGLSIGHNFTGACYIDSSGGTFYPNLTIKQTSNNNNCMEHYTNLDSATNYNGITNAGDNAIITYKPLSIAHIGSLITSGIRIDISNVRLQASNTNYYDLSLSTGHNFYGNCYFNNQINFNNKNISTYDKSNALGYVETIPNVQVSTGTTVSLITGLNQYATYILFFNSSIVYRGGDGDNSECYNCTINFTSNNSTSLASFNYGNLIYWSNSSSNFTSYSSSCYIYNISNSPNTYDVSLNFIIDVQGGNWTFGVRNVKLVRIS